jgi:DNA-binding NarL/FixJ family response regulator
MKALILEDHEMFRDILHVILREEAAEAEIFLAGTLEAARDFMRSHEITYLIADIELPDGDGLKFVQEASESNPRLCVLAVSAQIDEMTLRRVSFAPIVGFVDKTTETMSSLRSAICETMTWNPYFSESALSFKRSDRRVLLDPYATLTDKERELLELFALGLCDKTIATRIGGRVKTIQTHRKNAMAKLGVSSVGELIRHCLRYGYIHAIDFKREQVSVPI